MICRPATISDLPAIGALAKDYPYPDLRKPDIEALHVVIDDQGHVVMACAAKRLVELYLYSGEAPPMVRIRALEMLHRDMATALKEKEYTEANCFLPPQIEKRFGKRLMRSFGWCKNWASLYLNF